MSAQVTGRKRIPNREKLTAEDDALSQIAREAEARLAAKRAARAEAREIRMKELERQQKEIYQAQKKYYGLDSKWGHIEQWMEDSERYSRHSRRHASISDDEERMSVGSRGSLRGNYSDLCSSTGSLPSSRLQNGRPSALFSDAPRSRSHRPSDYSGFLGSGSRASSRASSARASPVVSSSLCSFSSGSRTASTLSAATLASLGGGLSRRGSCDTSISADTEASIREIKDSLVEVEEKYKKAMVSNAQLDNEKSNLMYQVDTLRDTLMELEELLYETRRECEEKSREYERERHAHSILQFQFNEMKETLKQSEELLTDAQHLHMKQDGYVREISDLQETLEWKEKKIGALERQKDYSDIIRDERDALKDEVFRLRDALKKHGIVIGSEVTTNGETGGNGIDGPENEESASRLAQEAHTPVTSGDSMLERSPDGRGSEVDSRTSGKTLRQSVASQKSCSSIPRRRIRVETRESVASLGTSMATPMKSLNDIKPTEKRIFEKIQEVPQINHKNPKVGESLEAKYVPEAFKHEIKYQDKENPDHKSISDDINAEAVKEKEAKTAEQTLEKHFIMIEEEHYEEPHLEHKTQEDNQIETTTGLLNEDLNVLKLIKDPQTITTQDHSNLANQNPRKQERNEIEMPGTSHSQCQDLINPLKLDDVTLSSSSLEIYSWTSEEEDSETEPELELEDIQGCRVAVPVEETGIAVFLDSCEEAGNVDFEVFVRERAYVHQKETETQEKRLKSRRKHDCSVS
ncbi:leucine-rich repeat flightless-interacting protein 1 isoform X3 [Astyanax mexicanus]|uniref:Leucine-rich repeat flightless-interacting protein 1 isoform X3 n=1 Tax=Astyanax mexicanus TaxID=7994 RepID=A0A8T2M8I2_ASTMX|nr:leucine-rich repeat flightless-interacting protein 1 isoform X3 [Astyanax mexicanus]